MRPKWHIILALVTVLAASTAVSLGNKETAPGQEEDELIVDEDLQDEDVSDQGEDELIVDEDLQDEDVSDQGEDDVIADEDLASVDLFAAGGPIKCDPRCDNTKTCIDGTCYLKTSVCNGQVMVDGEVCCGKGKTKAPCDGECINGACCGDTADESPCNGICCGDGFICVDTGCCKPLTEVCDGVDNDCDGSVDDGNPGSGVACSTGEPGVCAAGTTNCESGVIVCSQNVLTSLEICDGKDNDCDGSIDDGNPEGGAACDTGGLGVCAAGTTNCESGVIVCSQNVQASTEVCDTRDNDCDGVTNEDDVCAGKKQNGEGCQDPTECISGYCKPGTTWTCQPVPSGGLIDGTECDPANDQCTNDCTSPDGTETFYRCGGCLGISNSCDTGGEWGACCSGYYCATDHGAAMCDCRNYGESCDATMLCCPGALKCNNGVCGY